ncbi:hypothetical protein [Leadbettera azotonutricia]|uniref:Putative lipoprotein n=1 Tax=Leadbettera azotonutricia (strain ATCC BAA-888 / DSM 13862 / ZAS-9) TaxID=545695 RepID=F5Y790_LEAAZ|nr:hypothetical protein [Leadbettera azotonutricia]AEF81691.1 putative lipoprotein [Leadbettera azotonutricia ZAS-9]
MMKNCKISAVLLLLMIAGAFFAFSCKGNPPPAGMADPDGDGLGQADWESAQADSLDHPRPNDLYFTPAPMPGLSAAPGVGNVTKERRDRGSALNADEREALSDSFKAAYVDGILRGQPITGVLGGDQVHGWPENSPSGWVQNWQTSEPRPNSWGIPSIILAVQSIEILTEMAQNRVFMVQGGVLDYYGKSSGSGGANGDRGYGSPRGEEFYYNGSIAQRFEKGLIVADWQGKGAFLPGLPPSDGLEAPREVGSFSPSPPGYTNAVGDAFLTAWKMALDRNIETMAPDGEGIYIPFANDPWGIPGGLVKGLYIQTFNKRTCLLVLPDTSALPRYARFIASPFLDVLLFPDDYPLPGSEGLEGLNINFTGGDAFIKRLMRGIALYGLPLSDPLPRRQDNPSKPWQEAQRFSRGWLAGSPGGSN